MWRALVVTTLAAALAAGCKGDRARCERAARNYAELVYWERSDREIAALPPPQQAEERKRRMAVYTAKVEADIEFFIAQCRAANNDDQVECMIAAKTGSAARKCAELIRPK
jgi:hypothetical protein